MRGYNLGRSEVKTSIMNKKISHYFVLFKRIVIFLAVITMFRSCILEDERITCIGRSMTPEIAKMCRY